MDLTPEEAALLEQLRATGGRVTITQRPQYLMLEILKVGRSLQAKGIATTAVDEQPGRLRSLTVELTSQAR